MKWTEHNWPSQTIPFADEKMVREWEALPEGEKSAQIAEKRARSLVYGWCQSCHGRIETLGRDWPARCPHCGAGDGR